MRAAVCGVLAAACVVCLALAAACSRDNEAEVIGVQDGQNVPASQPADRAADKPNPKPDPAALSAEDAMWQEWINFSPTRATMRSMWVNSALIAGNGPDVDGASFFVVIDAAENIALKSSRMASFWQEISDENKVCATAGTKADWDAAYDAIDKAHHACGGCHYEYWPLAARGYLPETLRRWKQDQSVHEGAPWGPQVYHAPSRISEQMREMQTKMSAVYDAVNAQDAAKVKTSTLDLHRVVEAQLLFWRSVESQAEKIVAAAREGDRKKIQTHYNAMTNQCRACHAGLEPGRATDPLPWPDMGD